MSLEKEILRKADLALADLASGGLMQPEQSDTFFKKVIDSPTIVRDSRVVRMSKTSALIDKVGLGGRVMRAANQGTISSPLTGEEGTRAVARADRVKPTLSQIRLDAKEIIAEINLGYETLENIVEGGKVDDTGFQDLILGMIGDQVAYDIEEKAIMSDTAVIGDPYLALSDGAIKQIVSNTLNHGGAAVSPELFKNMIDALPDKYLRLLPLYKFYTSVSREMDYRLQVSNRQTSLGDAVLTGTIPVPVMGVPMRGASIMPNDKIVLMDPKNLLIGIHRNIRIEFDKDVRERAFIIVLTMSVDHKFQEEDMTVKATNVGAYTN